MTIMDTKYTTERSRDTGAGVQEAPLKVVYVAGSGHTGSTLLALLLNAHPRIVSVGETSIKPKIRHRGTGAAQPCSCGTAIADCEFWKRVFCRVNELGFELSASRWTNDYRLTHPMLHRVLTKRSSVPGHRQFQNWAASHLPVFRRRMQHADRVNVAFVRAVLEVADADVFFDTSKRLVRLSRLLQLPELDVAVVRLMRDVRGYVASAKRRGYSIADATRSWTQTQSSIAASIANIPAEKKLLVKYEDLCANVSDTMARLYRFCGVDSIDPFTSPKLNRHHVIGNRMRLNEKISVRLDESWRVQLAPEEQQRILAVAGDINRGFGYV